MSEQTKTTGTSRRDFLKTAGIGSVGLAAVANLNIARGVNVGGSDLIKVALIGCGGRGAGSLQDRFAVGDNVKVVALCDVVDEPMQNALKLLSETDHKDKLDVGDRVFSGFDGYKQAIDCCDQALIASPPAFHPIHYKYAVEQGKHVFIEKPFGVDAPGYRLCMAANKIADDKGLTVCGGYQRRHQNDYREWIKRIHDGEIGDVLSTRVYWNGAGAKNRGFRAEGEPEIRFQARDWYFFNWLSGDHIVEQHCHNIDVGNWIHGKGDPFAHPVSCVGMGGRQVRKTPGFPYNECGNIFDHHYVEYTYADGSIMHSQCRQIPGCWNSVTEKVLGSAGNGQIAWLQKKGGPRWQYRGNGDKSGYVQEHINQVNAIRNGEKLNDGWHSATATMIAVMGWMATYSGREIKWDEAVEKGRDLFPYDVELTFDTPSPVMPGPDGTFEHAVAVPGKYDPFA